MAFDGIVSRSACAGCTRHRALRGTAGTEMPGLLQETIVFNDSATMREAACLGLGVALVAIPDLLPQLERGELQRLVPRW
jgi:DNA-binding transcriptional LysR family regulator